MLLLLSPRGRLVDSTARDSIFSLTAFAETFATLLAFAFAIAFATAGTQFRGFLPQSFIVENLPNPKMSWQAIKRSSIVSSLALGDRSLAIRSKA